MGFFHLPEPECAHSLIAGKEGQYLCPQGQGNLWGGVPPTCGPISHPVHLARNSEPNIPRSMATSDFPSMTYSATPEPQSALVWKTGIPASSAHHPYITGPGLLLSYLCAFTRALCPHPPGQDCPSSSSLTTHLQLTLPQGPLPLGNLH